MVDFDSTKMNIQNQELSTTTPVGSEEVSVPKKPEKPTIEIFFKNKMTRQQVADEFGQVGLDMFDKANTDGKDGISEDEYIRTLDHSKTMDYMMTKAFERNLEKSAKEFREIADRDSDISEQKMLRDFDIQTCIKMEKMKNPSITDEEARKNIENKFNEKQIKYAENVFSNELNLSKHFIEDLKNTAKKIDITTISNMTEEQEDAVIKVFAGGNYVRIGLTKEQAEKIGGNTLEAFKKISSDGNVITEEDYAKHLQNKIKEIGVSKEQILKLLATSDPEKAKEIREKLLTARYGEVDYNNEFGDIKELDTLLIKVSGKSINDIGKMSDEERGKALFIGLRDRLKNKMDSNSKDSDYSKEFERLKNGNFDEDEIKNYGLGGVLSAEELDKYAKLAVYKNYIKEIRTISNNIFSGAIDEDKSAVIRGLTTELKNSPEFQQLLIASGLDNIEDLFVRKQTSDYVAKNIDNVDDSVESVVLTSAVINNSSADAIKEFVTNNAAQADFIDSVSHVILQTMPDSEYKTQLASVINQTIEDIHNGTIPGYTGNTSSSNNSGESTASIDNDTVVGGGYSGVTDNNANIPPQPTQVWSSNPITAQVNDTRQQSYDYYNEKLEESTGAYAKGNISTSTFILNIENDASKSAEYQKIKSTMEKVRNLSMGQALSVLLKECPQEFLDKFIEHVKAISKPELREAYVNGNDELRKFLKSIQEIHSDDIVDYFDKNKTKLSQAPKTVQIEYMAAKTEDIRLGFDKPENDDVPSMLKDKLKNT